MSSAPELAIVRRHVATTAALSPLSMSLVPAGVRVPQGAIVRNGNQDDAAPEEISDAEAALRSKQSARV